MNVLIGWQNMLFQPKLFFCGRITGLILCPLFCMPMLLVPVVLGLSLNKSLLFLNKKHIKQIGIHTDLDF